MVALTDLPRAHEPDTVLHCANRKRKWWRLPICHVLMNRKRFCTVQTTYFRTYLFPSWAFSKCHSNRKRKLFCWQLCHVLWNRKWFCTVQTTCQHCCTVYILRGIYGLWPVCCSSQTASWPLLLSCFPKLTDCRYSVLSRWTLVE